MKTREKRQQINDDQVKESLPVIFCRILYAGAPGALREKPYFPGPGIS